MSSAHHDELQFLRMALDAPMLDAETERAYLARIQDRGDPEAMRRLLASHLRLVVAVARSYARHGIELEDLIGEGNLGLLEAVRRFDRSRNIRFATYAAWWVRALIRRYAMANRRVVAAASTRKTERRLEHVLGEQPTREQVAEALGVTVEDIAMVEASLGGRDVPIGARGEEHTIELSSPQLTPEEEVAEQEAQYVNAQRVSAALAELDARERFIVEKRFLDDRSATLRELGSKMGVSRERIRQLQLRACEHLHALLDDAA
jgi:RNA polymerase sigma-32 factor